VSDRSAGRETFGSDANIPDSPSALLYFIAAAAVLFGIWGRFKGLGTWPLSDDEYYTARAVQDILRVGWPEYDCGGWYLRSLPSQYLSALLQLAGLSPELSLRAITAVAGLLVLPAAYILGKRAHGATGGLLAVTILAASLWAIELARFGRMYTPFQAIFTWYLVYFVRYVVDKDRRALWPMLTLSVLGAIVWEGGIFILALNALPPFIGNTAGRLSLRQATQVALACLLAAPALLFDSSRLRYLSDVPPFPDWFDSPLAPQPMDPAVGWMQQGQNLLAHPAWLIVMALAFASAIPALAWIWRFRARWLTASALALVLLLALGHQFTAAASVLVAALLARILQPADLLTRGGARLGAAILLSLLAWSCLGLFSDLWISPDARTWLGEERTYAVFLELFGRPDFLRQIVQPWVGAESIYGLVLLLTLGFAVINDLRSPSPYSQTLSVLLLVLVLMLIAVGMAHPPRQATRYVFFLYPVVVIIVATTGLIFIPRLRRSAAIPALVAPLAVLLGFTLLEDFRPAHVIAIDSAAVNFRIGMVGRADNHIISRTDPRSAAQWLETHADRPDDLLVNGFPAASFYSTRFDFAYTDIENQRYTAFACTRGTVERWSNLPLLSDRDALAAEVRRHGRTFFVADRPQEAQLLAEMSRFQPTIVWRSLDRGISVIRMAPDDGAR